MLPHAPFEATGKEPNAAPLSAPHSPKGAPSLVGGTMRSGREGGGNGSAVGSSRGGRRQVHARLHGPVNTANSAASPSAASPTAASPLGAFAGDTTRPGGGSYLFPAFPAHQGERNASIRSTDQPISHSSSTDDPSTHAPMQQHPGGERAEQEERQRQVQRQEQEARTNAKKEAVASILADPERYRRAVASGSSNPLHVWGHETAFIKSRYFSAKRRDNVSKHTDQTVQAERYIDESLTPETVPGAGVWSRASSVQSPNSPSNGVNKRLLADCGGNGAGGGGGGSGAAGGGSGGNNSGSDGLGDYYLPKAAASMLEKNDTWSAQDHCRTRNMNALHAFSWDQRVFLPQRRGMLSSVFDLLASPRFWEKLDWTVRGSVLTILPTLILCAEPTTRHIFPLPTSVVFLAYWTTQPTLGAGLRETFVVMKGFSISLVILLVIITVQPGPAWVTLIILFCCLLVTGFVAEQLKRMVAYCFASLLMQYISSPQNTGYNYVGKYYATILIGQGFGLASFMFPYIRWSSENARRYIIITGDAVSLSVHGTCCSFWVVNSLLERQLHVARLRQLRQTITASMQKAQQALSEMGYEPHSGVYTARLKTRMAFLRDVFNVLQSTTIVIEQVAANPALVETAMCREFGERIRGELNLIAAAMDSIILRIVDLDNLVSVTDMTAFRLARTRYEEALSTVRDEVILSNPDYRTDNSDILLGFFLFSVEELMEIIGNFQDAAKPPSSLWYFVTFPLRDLQSSWAAFVDLYHAIRIRRSITRRLKEAIKLSVCIIVAAIFQVYAMDSSSTSPVAGVDIIAFVYRSTGGESFQYSTMRMLGIVLGSLTGLLSVQIANGRRPVLYGCTLVLTFIGSYVQAAPEYGALGNALANSVISMVLSYADGSAAITRIQQNCFAILIYFIISSIIWPVRGRTKVNTGLDVSLRMAREATDRLLRNLDLPDSATAVSADVLALLGEMQKKVSQQLQNIPGAIAEPTLDSVGFPEIPWRMLVSAQRKLLVTLFMMRHAYHTFMTSTIADIAGGGGKDGKTVNDNVDMIGAGPAAATSISVHWVVLHRISPYTRQLSQLFYEAMEVYLLTLSKATFVPTAELTRLRLGMMQCYDRIVSVYIETVQHELNNSDGDESASDGEDDRASDSSDSEGRRRRGGFGSSGTTRVGGGVDVGGRGAMALENVAGFVPPPASTFAPSAATVGGTADSSNDVRLNGSMVGVKNSSMRGSKSGSVPTGSFRRPSSSGADAGSSSKKTAGHFSYKLTPEERQRLREYVLGPTSAGMNNASFFATAAALAAAAEQGGAGAGATVNAAAATAPAATTAAAPQDSNAGARRGSAAPANADGANPGTTNFSNQTFAGGFMSNHSMFNAAGSFWNRNVSMFDPGMLRNAGIVVQEPVHEDPTQQRRDGSESAGRSTRHSLLRHSSAHRSASGGAGEANRGGGQSSSIRGAGDTSEMARGADQLTTVSDANGSNLPPPRSASAGPSSIRSSPSPQQPPLQPGRRQSSPAPQPHEPPATAIEGSNPMGVVKRSKTSKHAVPSVLQMSMVLPAGAYALRNFASGDAATTTNDDPPQPRRSSSLSIVVPSASRLDPPSAENTGDAAATTSTNRAGASSSLLASNRSFMSGGAGTAAGAGGDVFSLGRAARNAVRPANAWSATGLSGGARRRPRDDGQARHDRGSHFSEESTHAPLSPGGWDREGGTDDGRDSARHHRANSPRAASDAPTAAPSMRHAATSPTTGSPGTAAAVPAAATSPREGKRAELMSCDAHEPFEGEIFSGEDASEQRAEGQGPQREGTTIAADLVADAGLSVADDLLPAPLSAPGTGDRRVSNNSVTRPFFNNSFSAAGPAIPDALRGYVENLAEQQRQQVPPPPAILGNMSFINVAATLPVVNRSFIGGNANSDYVFNGTFAGMSGGMGGNSSTLPSGHGPLSAGGMDATTPALPTASAATAAPPASAAMNEAIQADFMSAVSKLEFNNGTFCAPFRGGDRSTTTAAATATGGSGADASGGEGLLKLLDVGGADSDGGGNEYVLTNSDIHGLEAFLFGLRAIITQVEELERYLLEVVHGNEMASKL